MNQWLAYGIAASLLLSGNLSIAADEHHQPAPGGKAAAAPYNPSTATPSQSTLAMMQMDDHMKRMQVLHDRMMNARIPEERQKALVEARKEMQEGMAMMKPMMQDQRMMGGGMMAQKGKPADANTQLQTMSKRIDMMQMMMQMMMDQQAMTMPPTGEKP